MTHCPLLATVPLLVLGCTHISPRPAEPSSRYERELWDTRVERRTEPDREVRAALRSPEHVAWSLKRCRPIRHGASVYGLGSSTMRILLGPLLKRMFRRAPLRYDYWGVPSTGIARPDYFDWQEKLPGIRNQHKPNIWIVSLGTNDLQALRKRTRGWARFGTADWRRLYGRRIDRMLHTMSGPGRRAAVIWLGPTAFNTRNSMARGPILTALMKERVEAFGGPALFVDSYAATTDSNGIPLKTIRVRRKGRMPVYGKDGIHLKRYAVKALIANRVRKLVLTCLAGERP